ncbi:MAG: hypothetical protein IIC11_02430 [Proteobacteria bacterium]|nr:hypothetical protein [Pseudomonadota bacterium]
MESIIITSCTVYPYNYRVDALVKQFLDQQGQCRLISFQPVSTLPKEQRRDQSRYASPDWLPLIA